MNYVKPEVKEVKVTKPEIVIMCAPCRGKNNTSIY